MRNQPQSPLFIGLNRGDLSQWYKDALEKFTIRHHPVYFGLFFQEDSRHSYLFQYPYNDTFFHYH